MSNIKYIVNVQTGETFEIEMTEEELAAEAKERAEREKIEQAKQAQIAAKEAARQALLDKLGITAEEAKILLG